jgi:hypothetical protein
MICSPLFVLYLNMARHPSGKLKVNYSSLKASATTGTA